MLLHKNSLRIATVLDYEHDHLGVTLYNETIRSLLKKILPSDLFFCDFSSEEMKQEWIKEFHSLLPCIKWSHEGPSSLNLSIYLLCHYRMSAGKFFLEIISRWLMPAKKINIGLFFAGDFKLIDLSDSLYTVAEIVICVEDIQDIEVLKRNLAVIETEIRLGVVSVYHASRILEIKGLSTDEKTSLIQERIAALVQSRPQDFDYDIFIQMQQFLVLCRYEFKVAREFQQMSRIIYVFYLFRKQLRQMVEEAPGKRHLCLKLLKTRLYLPLGVKKVLSVFVGVNFLKENEVFEQRHLIKAFQNYIPNIKAVENSFFMHQGHDDSIHTIYLEVEKEEGHDFTVDEIKKLKRVLPDDLKVQVERLQRPIFMPRNEEEVMRNIVTLSQQLKYTKDIPQVVITFDEQTDTDLTFTVVLVRVLLSSDTPAIQDLFQKGNSYLRCLPDRVRKVGLLRKKYPKEATVFRLCLPNTSFLRGDHSVDLYKARQEIFTELQRVVGEVRDFNGGMISKQIEVFLQLKKMLGEVGQKNEFLLENFYHSIFPVEMRSVLDPEILKVLFLMLLEMSKKSSEEKKKGHLSKKEGEKHLFVMLSVQDFSLKKSLFDAMDRLFVLSPGLISIHLQLFDVSYLGYIYSCEDRDKRQLFYTTIEQALDF